jgi:hypothetical protein
MGQDIPKRPEEAAERDEPRRMTRRSVIGAGGAAAAGAAGAVFVGSAGVGASTTTNDLPTPIKSVSEYIAAATVIATQIQSNPTFASAVQADPQGELTKIGIGEDAVRELLTGEVGFAAAGTGYICVRTCFPISCLTTGACCCTHCVPDSAFGEPVDGIAVSEGRAQLAQSLVKWGHLKLPKIPK